MPSPFDSRHASHPFTLGVGAHRRAKDWRNRTFRLDEFVAAMATRLRDHEGEKDGLGFLPGPLIEPYREVPSKFCSFFTTASGGQRTAVNMLGADVTWLDIDYGTSTDAMLAALNETGLLYLAWHTYSHLKTDSTIAASSVQGDWTPGIQSALRANGVHEEIVASVQNVRPATVSERIGGKWFERKVLHYSHIPLHKLRVMFLNAARVAHVAPDRPAGSPQWYDHKDDYKAARRGLAQQCGAVIADDDKTDDLSRLNYAPCRPEGSDPSLYQFFFQNGALLDWDSLPRVAGKKSSRPKGPKGPKAPTMKEPKATSLWEYDGITYEFKTPNLLKFLAVSRNFQAADWLESERSKVVNYRRKSPVKTACLCPLHLEHNNAGNPRDDGFHVNNATEAHSWSMACSHGSGPHHRVQDRAIFLDVLCTMAGVEDARDLLKFTRRVDAA